ncbi:MAG: ATP synthase F1 subunit gamma [Candidatus Yonathbacteria bacterium RIFCSPLOWO2_01_FULL_47_33b]|uniref:ATP synthase gamma chain n=1 Tax=Candidatus Yonathbacteria bacterium RIFCSPLOWO2_01_FULL_47_33b TaxID=1802727 RepID=A0A1G2SG88_9BACT|nr:MAG: ATP synthase F1 subunit gamma [Candidatus Yonathbacteria bacterium RIFCSPLOWO2_01_FULL_47_33b]
MSNLRAIKDKIRSVGKTHQVTKAMEAVSGVKMRKAQISALTARPYALAAFRILARVSSSIDLSRHPFLRARTPEAGKALAHQNFPKENLGGRVLAVVITSDKGLAGGLNSSLLKRVVTALDERGVSREHTGILAVGRKGEDYFARRGYILEEKIPTIGDESLTTDFGGIVELVSNLFARNEYDECILAYTNFRSTFEQEPVVRTLLPLSIEGIEEMIKGIAPEKGKFTESKEATEKLTHSADYLFEPSPEAVLETLLPRLISVELHHAFLESKASEHSARMVAMRNASDKAEEVEFLLTREYNKARQSAITREMSEIIGGIEAMR